MKQTSMLTAGLSVVLCATASVGQSGPAPTAAPSNPQYAVMGRPDAAATGQSGEPVSYASVTELNGMLEQLQATSKSTQADLVKLRIERWKTGSDYKKQALGNVDSIQRNLQTALPEIVAQLRAAPESLPATFKLYRNLDALYDVLGSVVEGTGAFGAKDDLQSLSNDLTGFESTRKQLAKRMETLSAAKEAEITRLRTDLKAAQAAAPAQTATAPRKVVVDDNEPAKKPVPKKKPATKPATPTTTPKPPAGQTQTPAPAQPQ